jgi:hypothetical protein
MTLLPRPALSILVTLAAVTAVTAGPALASPCVAPDGFVKVAATQRQPLTRPYVVKGLAVTALRQHDGASWLELAVDSEATARRALGTAAGEVSSVGGAVLLSCRAAAASAVASGAGAAPALLARSLW